MAAVFAHPDDDTFAVSGTVALHADDPGFRFILIHATSGEAGEIADPSLATRETLAAVREEEDRRSWRTLGREPDRHEWLRYPDGGLALVDFDEIVDRVSVILREERPDVVVTFGPDGITGHPDHVTIGRAATEAFHRLRGEGVGGFLRLLHGGIPLSQLQRWNEMLIADGKEPFRQDRLYDPHGVPDETIGFIVDCTAVAPRVLAALREHRTQASGFEDQPQDQQLAAVAWERGVVAWPPWSPGDPVLTDVFETLGAAGPGRRSSEPISGSGSPQP
jgi:LmbE family N-acetylglucosaminyl deacetylase